MARITSPGGETEFFEITELQQAFEKELKTGEKVIVTPGVKEASFLREAPIRAELEKAWAEFRERVLNPIDPYQPEVPRPICPHGFFIVDSSFDFSLCSGTGFKATATPIVIADWNGSGQAPFPGQFSVPTFPYYTGIQQSVGSHSGGGTFTFPTLTQNSLPVAPSVNYSSFTIPDYLTITMKIKNVDSVTGTVNLSGIRITQTFGGFNTGLFNCNNIPDTVGSQEIILAELKWDGTVTILPFACGWGTYTNYRFTNFYP